MKNPKWGGHEEDDCQGKNKKPKENIFFSPNKGLQVSNYKQK